MLTVCVASPPSWLFGYPAVSNSADRVWIAGKPVTSADRVMTSGSESPHAACWPSPSSADAAATRRPLPARCHRPQRHSPALHSEPAPLHSSWAPARVLVVPFDLSWLLRGSAAHPNVEQPNFVTGGLPMLRKVQRRRSSCRSACVSAGRAWQHYSARDDIEHTQSERVRHFTTDQTERTVGEQPATADGKPSTIARRVARLSSH